MLRQKGCPSLFLTLSCAEFDWIDLLKEIIETVQRRRVSKEYVEQLPEKVKNKLISENVVQSTLHFQKRIAKLFSLMKYKFFNGKNATYHVSTYFYRIEFQLWLQDEKNRDAPNFWISEDNEDLAFETDETEVINKKNKRHGRIC